MSVGETVATKHYTVHVDLARFKVTPRTGLKLQLGEALQFVNRWAWARARAGQLLQGLRALPGCGAVRQQLQSRRAGTH